MPFQMGNIATLAVNWKRAKFKDLQHVYNLKIATILSFYFKLPNTNVINLVSSELLFLFI